MTRNLKQNTVRVYEPGASIKMGWFSIWREMLKEMISSRELIWRLFLRDFLAKYKQAILGISWAIIMPLTVIGAFISLNRAGVINIGKIDTPYPIFALLGLTIWQLFATGLTATSNCILQSGSMVVKINFAKEALVIASFAQAVFEFIVHLGLLVIVFIIFRVTPSWTVIFFPLALVPLILLTLGLGFIFSLLSVLMRDMPYVITLLTTLLLFLTPVLYPTPSIGIFAGIMKWNPLAILVTGTRDIVIIGRLTQPLWYLLASVFSFVVFLVCWRLFHLVESRIAERV